MTTALCTRLQALRTELNAKFPERRDVIDGLLCVILAGEHILLLGPPGTAKSYLTRTIAAAFGGTYFERLLTKFSTPEELYGPISLKGLENDRYTRITTGKMPEAHFALGDEIFKANSAILNTLLTILNEHLFHNDGSPMVCPLITFFGASNELPDGKELEALFDRFLLRYEVQYVLRPASIRSVLLAEDKPITNTFTLDELKALQAATAAVTITDATVDALLEIRNTCKAEAIDVSDRRWRKTLKIVQAYAFLAGESTTTAEDLLILTDALWRTPKDRPKIARLVGVHADPVSAKAAEILDAARDTAARVAGTKAANDKRSFMNAATQALEDFTAQRNKLSDLAQSAGRRAKLTITDATNEITQLHGELARSIATGLGLSR